MKKQPSFAALTGAATLGATLMLSGIAPQESQALQYTLNTEFLRDLGDGHRVPDRDDFG